MDLLVPATSFGKMVEIMCDHYQILDNFCKMENYWISSVSYINNQGVMIASPKPRLRHVHAVKNQQILFF